MSESQATLGHHAVGNQHQVIDAVARTSQVSPSAPLSKKAVIDRIEKFGVIPSLRLESADDAFFVAEAFAAVGLPVIEISAGEAEVLTIISSLVRHHPGMLVGAGNIFDVDTARRCLEAGARFLTSDVFLPAVVDLAAKEDVAVIAGAMTPTEIITAWTAGADFVKVTPCGANGHDYIRFLKAALPQVRLIAAGGVTQLTAVSFVKAGATAFTASDELVPLDAIVLRQTSRIQELARRFLSFAKAGRP